MRGWEDSGRGFGGERGGGGIGKEGRRDDALRATPYAYHVRHCFSGEQRPERLRVVCLRALRRRIVVPARTRLCPR